MFKRVLKSIKPNRKTGFNAYMSNLNRTHETGGPTADEARKDYRAAARSASPWTRF